MATGLFRLKTDKFPVIVTIDVGKGGGLLSLASTRTV
jgi:hypothetical protein